VSRDQWTASIPGRRAHRLLVRFDSAAATGCLPLPVVNILRLRRTCLHAHLPISPPPTHTRHALPFCSVPFPPFSRSTIAAACPRIPLSIRRSAAAAAITLTPFDERSPSTAGRILAYRLSAEIARNSWQRKWSED